MGRLEPACFSFGSDNALYALVFAYDLSIAKGADNAVVALIKSNASPSGPDALTWQVVSTIRQAELATIVEGGTFGYYPVQCLVDPSGGFLAWSYQTYQPGQPRNRPRPGGFRYDPLLTTPSSTTTGKGGWVNVDSPITYSWTMSSSAGDGSLMYLADGAGKYNYYHAYVPTSGTSLNFGALNTGVTPHLMEDSATQWALNFSTTGYIKNVRISSTNVFLWGSDTIFKNPFTVATLPQSGPLPTTAPLFQAVNFTTAGQCATSGVLRNSVYSYCADRKTHGDQYSLYEWNGSKSSGPISMTKLPSAEVFTTGISGIFGDPASTTYLLVQSGYMNGGRPTSGTILKALVLTGTNAGTVLDVPKNITVSDNLSSMNATTGGPEGPGRNGGSGGKGDDELFGTVPAPGMSSTVKVILGVVGAFLVIGFALAIVLRKRKQRKFMVMQEHSSTIHMQPTDGVGRRV
ncbi:hypothetical protein BGZ75_007114 [Mortierella antarctica]|nr:hypothetical protein BGZ75_007114 [Mortierella antarctica]